MRTTNDNSWLLPYLEGTLDPQQTAEIEARLAADPRLYAEAEHLRRTLDSLRETASRAPLPAHAAPPADLWPRLRARIVLEPAPRRPITPTRLWWAGGASLAAASLVLAGIFWHPPHQVAEGGHIRPSAAPRQIARNVPLPSEAAGRHAARPAVTLPRQIAAVPKPPASAPVITLADPFAVPKPLTPPITLPKPPQAAKRVPSSVTVTAQKPPVQIASSGANIGRPPELAGSYYARAPSAPVLAAPPMLPAPTASPSPLVPTSPLVPPAPAAAPSSSAVDALNQTATANSPVVTADRAQKAKSQPNTLDQSRKLFIKPSVPAQARLAAPEATVLPEAHEAGLDDWQAALAGAMRPPLWGETAGMQQANQALLDAQMAGRLNDLQTQLETQRGASPRDVITGRMLAAVDDFGGSPSAALEERRRIVTLNGSNGEDWFALAQSEERAGNGSAARAAYQRALASPIPPPPFHAAIARQRSQ